jgi:hypothetical protein
VFDLQGAGVPLPSFGLQEHARSIEKSVRLIHVSTANREIPSVDHDVNCQWAFAAGKLPCVAVNFPHTNALTVCMAFKGFYVPRKVTNEIAAWNPGGQANHLPTRVRLVDLQSNP